MAQILIAEDQSDLLKMIVSSMRLEGHQVLAASNGQSALDCAEQEQPDLLILDVDMPKISGDELCRQLKRRQNFRDTPIILISAKSGQKEIDASLASGAVLHLPKPFALKTLVSHVNSLLA